MIQKKKLTMPFWLRDLFSFSWRPATPADILRAWELLKDKSGETACEWNLCGGIGRSAAAAVLQHPPVRYAHNGFTCRATFFELGRGTKRLGSTN